MSMSMVSWSCPLLGILVPNVLIVPFVLDVRIIVLCSVDVKYLSRNFSKAFRNLPRWSLLKSDIDQMALADVIGTREQNDNMITNLSLFIST